MPLPSWLTRFRGESRSLENPTVPLSAATLDALWGGRSSASGVNVTPETALETTAVLAAVRVIASTVASLPLVVYRRTGDGKERAPNHPLYRLLHDAPNPVHSSFVLRELLTGWLLLYGNAYCEVERDAAGRVLALWPLNPARVQVQFVNDTRAYVVSVNGQFVALPADNVLHLAGFGTDGIVGLSPVALGRHAIGLSQATEQYGSAFFSNGAQPSGVLTHPSKLSTEATERLRASWNAAHSGLTKAQRVAVLEDGLTWTPLGIPPEHAQFLETRKFSVTEVARLFNIPPHLIGDLERATFSNIEHQSIAFAQLCITPLCRRIEGELTKLFGDDRAHFAEFSLDGLLRGDSKARAEFYASALTNGWLSVNEVRAMENRNPVPGGDTLRAPLNMAPIDGQPQDGPSDE